MLYTIKKELQGIEPLQKRPAFTLAEKLGLQRAAALVVDSLDQLPGNESAYINKCILQNKTRGEFWADGAEIIQGELLETSTSEEYKKLFTLKNGKQLKKAILYKNGVAVIFENPTTQEQEIYTICQR